MKIENPKFCVDCKHHATVDGSHRCVRTNRTDISEAELKWLVIGGEKPLNSYHCETERKGYLAADCGPEAKYFEALLQ